MIEFINSTFGEYHPAYFIPCILIIGVIISLYISFLYNYKSRDKPKFSNIAANYFNILGGGFIGWGCLEVKYNLSFLIFGIILLTISFYYKFIYDNIKIKKTRELSKDEILKKKLNILTKRKFSLFKK